LVATCSAVGGGWGGCGCSCGEDEAISVVVAGRCDVSLIRAKTTQDIVASSRVRLEEAGLAVEGGGLKTSGEARWRHRFHS